MLDAFIKLVIGDLDEKRLYKQAHKQFKKRVDALPKEYQFALRKMRRYMLNCGVDLSPDLVDLFEASAAEGREVLDVIGDDVSKFCDEFMQAASDNTQTMQEKLNKNVIEKFKSEEQ